VAGGIDVPDGASVPPAVSVPLFLHR